MNNTNPIIALSIFFVLAIFTYLLFKPRTGWYWLLKKGQKTSDKIIIEDVLKQLFHAEEERFEMGLNALLGVLKIPEKTIIPILDTMQSTGLVESQKGRYSLLPEGREYALKIIRVHRLYEKYLSEKTGYDKMEWHGKAEDMEHKFDDIATENLALELGNPRFDPHGDPIPTPDGELASVNGESLADLPINTVGRIVHIEDEPEIIYRQILAENIHIGSQIRVIESNPKRIRFYSEGEDFILAPVVAANITVLAFHPTDLVDEGAVRLSSLQPGERAKVLSISRESRGDARRRLLDLGFVGGSDVQVDLTNPLGDPTAYLIKGATIALRKKQAHKILIKKEL